MACQVSEVGKHGKAERMHRMILNMTRCMDAVEYAMSVLNRSSSRAKMDRMSPLAVLTGQGRIFVPSLCSDSGDLCFVTLVSAP